MSLCVWVCVQFLVHKRELITHSFNILKLFSPVQSCQFVCVHTVLVQYNINHQIMLPQLNHPNARNWGCSSIMTYEPMQLASLWTHTRCVV